MSIFVIDYIILGIIALLIFVHPWFLRPDQGGRAFGFPFLVICAWGVWRLFNFDPATHNDVPGIGYFVVAVPYSLIASLFFAIRCAILRRRIKHKEPGNG